MRRSRQQQTTKYPLQLALEQTQLLPECGIAAPGFRPSRAAAPLVRSFWTLVKRARIRPHTYSAQRRVPHAHPYYAAREHNTLNASRGDTAPALPAHSIGVS